MITTDRLEVDEFSDLSWRLHRSDPLWIPPLRARLRQELTGADAFGAYGRMRLFGVQNGGDLVGRVAAIVNPNLTDADGSVVGQVGYFEATDDADVATSLFAAAFDWLRSSGAHRVWGPMNGGAHRAHRLMTAGFDRTPFLFEPRNPAYYPGLFERAGFERAASWFSCDVTADQLQHALSTLPMFKIPDRLKDRYDVVPAERIDPPEVLQRLYPLLNPMWTGHVGYAPVSFEEFADAFGPALSLMHPHNLSWLSNRETGGDLGCVFGYPDHADDVRALNGDATGWGRWRSAATLPRRAVLHTIGMAKEARGRGLAMWLLRWLYEGCIAHYQEGVIALAVENFAAHKKVAPVSREYALYARTLV